MAQLEGAFQILFRDTDEVGELSRSKLFYLGDLDAARDAVLLQEARETLRSSQTGFLTQAQRRAFAREREGRLFLPVRFRTGLGRPGRSAAIDAASHVRLKLRAAIGADDRVVGLHMSRVCPPAPGGQSACNSAPPSPAAGATSSKRHPSYVVGSEEFPGMTFWTRFPSLHGYYLKTTPLHPRRRRTRRHHLPHHPGPLPAAARPSAV